MLPVVESIRMADTVNRFGPAIIDADSSISYGQLLDLVARISNIFDERKLPRLSKALLNIADRDARLIVTLAAMHYGLIPYVVADVSDILGQMDYDTVIGGANLSYPDIAPNLTIDQAALDAAPRGLRAFADRADDDILYISSTTGTTKGRRLIAEFTGVFKDRSGFGSGPDKALKRSPNDFWTNGDRDRVMATFGGASPFGFNSTMWVLERRAAIVRDQRSAADNVALVNRAGVTRIATTPATMERFVEHMESAGIRCPSVKRIAIGGSFAFKPLLERIERNFDAEIVLTYGTNEAGRVSAGTVTAASFQTGYVGELHPELTVSSTGTRQEPARLTIANRAATFAHYYDKGSLTRVEVGPYTLPDLGFVEGRSVYLVGRDDEVHDVNGNKVAFTVLNDLLRQMPGVRDVGMASGVPIGQPTELYIAVVGEDANLAALADRISVAFLSTSAKDHVHLFKVAEIRRNSTGKVEREALLNAYRAQA